MVWVFGENSKGELGVGDYSLRNRPYPLVNLKDAKVQSVSVGGNFCFAVTQDIAEPKKDQVQHEGIKDSLASSSVASYYDNSLLIPGPYVNNPLYTNYQT